jgi:ribosomal protein L37AE/L43A
MATNQTPVETYRCPKCNGAIVLEARSWGCEDCGYAPPHGAD